MNAVDIAGVGMTEFGKFPDRSPRSLVHEAVSAALTDAGMDGARVGAVYVSNAFGGSLQGQDSVRGQVWLGETDVAGAPVFNVENACAGGGSAISLARTAIVAGEVDVAVAVGVEKLTHPDRSKAITAMMGALDQEELPALRRSLGLSDGGSPFMRVYAGFAEAYMARSGATQEDFARVAAKTHAHGALNPRAQHRRAISVEEVLAARPVEGPLTVPMCAPIGDGAAAVVLTSAALASAGGSPVRLLASVVGSGRRGEDGLLVPGTARRAFDAAGISPQDVDVLEVHDAASPAELIVLEELGIAGPGEAVGLVRAGETALGGRIPVNPSGGLVSRGHPLGATGVAQVVELTDQLRARSGDRQVEGARLAVAENAGGYLGPDAAAAAITVLAR
ncbi:thiolase family protein [Aeromicrobium sp. CTD01-1L150]|uniref:thiolase family protein n=1 Tax=Aeromicrobium sp. CTD01-1L150 TaxID=3341830 RepID=UPI0035C12BA6